MKAANHMPIINHSTHNTRLLNAPAKNKLSFRAWYISSNHSFSSEVNGTILFFGFFIVSDLFYLPLLSSTTVTWLLRFPPGVMITALRSRRLPDGTLMRNGSVYHISVSRGV